MEIDRLDRLDRGRVERDRDVERCRDRDRDRDVERGSAAGTHLAARALRSPYVVNACGVEFIGAAAADRANTSASPLRSIV